MIFQIRQLSNHTALSDAVDMGKVYIKILEILAAEKNRAKSV